MNDVELCWCCIGMIPNRIQIVSLNSSLQQTHGLESQWCWAVVICHWTEAKLSILASLLWSRYRRTLLFCYVEERRHTKNKAWRFERLKKPENLYIYPFDVPLQNSLQAASPSKISKITSPTKENSQVFQLSPSSTDLNSSAFFSKVKVDCLAKMQLSHVAVLAGLFASVHSWQGQCNSKKEWQHVLTCFQSLPTKTPATVHRMKTPPIVSLRVHLIAWTYAREFQGLLPILPSPARNTPTAVSKGLHLVLMLGRTTFKIHPFASRSLQHLVWSVRIISNVHFSSAVTAITRLEMQTSNALMRHLNRDNRD